MAPQASIMGTDAGAHSVTAMLPNSGAMVRRLDQLVAGVPAVTTRAEMVATVAAATPYDASALKRSTYSGKSFGRTKGACGPFGK